MQAFHLPFPVLFPEHKIRHEDGIVLVGSCFTEHIGSRMQAGKMNALVNPNGILFNPMSIAGSIRAWINKRVYRTPDIFHLHETWSSWDFHSRFSHTDPTLALQGMNTSTEAAFHALREAKWLLVTFGSAYQYFTDQCTTERVPYGVANCHKAPGNWFEKRLLDIEEMKAEWQALAAQLADFNPGLKLLLTVSPVRHIRDGIVENNRSKARLIELAHNLSESVGACSYFPAYELVTDVLRDYRFFEADMVHPNAQAAQYVWDYFVDGYLENEDKALLKRIAELYNAMQHRPRFPETASWTQFRQAQLRKVLRLQEEFPRLDLRAERLHFGNSDGLTAY